MSYFTYFRYLEVVASAFVEVVLDLEDLAPFGVGIFSFPHVDVTYIKVKSIVK